MTQALSLQTFSEDRVDQELQLKVLENLALSAAWAGKKGDEAAEERAAAQAERAAAQAEVVAIARKNAEHADERHLLQQVCHCSLFGVR